MAKIELKGKIIAVMPVETVGEKDFKKQPVVFQVPGYVDDFGDKRGEDELWKIEVLGDKIDKLKMTGDLDGKKATLSVYINSRCIPKRAAQGTEPERPEMFILQAVLNDFKLYEK